MPNDLEKFLQQAAERLAQKANAAGRSAPGSNRPSAAPSSGPRRKELASGTRPGGRVPPTAEIIEAEVLENESRRNRVLREAGPNPLSTIDTRPGLAQSISQSDERMGDHVHQVFDHELSHMRAPSSSLSGSQANQSDRPTEVSGRATYKSPLLQMLRNPETLRAAFIVGEIFNRRP